MARSMKPERLSEAELIAETGVSRRNLTRWRQQGLVLPEEQRHGLGQGQGTTQLEYPAVAVAIIKRIIELRRNFKKVDEWRWRLWLEGYPVRIAPDLANALDRSRALATNIKTNIKSLDDIETKIFASAYGDLEICRAAIRLRLIFRNLSQRELRSVMTMFICIFLRDPAAATRRAEPIAVSVFQARIRVAGRAGNAAGPPSIFTRTSSKGFRNALLTATAARAGRRKVGVPVPVPPSRRPRGPHATPSSSVELLCRGDRSKSPI